MKQKYFNMTGEIAFRLWMFSNAYEVLKSHPNKEKAENLHGKVSAFANSPLVEEKALTEQRQDLLQLTEELRKLF